MKAIGDDGTALFRTVIVAPPLDIVSGIGYAPLLFAVEDITFDRRRDATVGHTLWRFGMPWKEGRKEGRKRDISKSEFLTEPSMMLKLLN